MDVLDLGRLKAPVLIFGGPYSNLHATRSLFEETRSLDIPTERIICNGDIVAYCGEPAETLSLITDWGIHCVMGNCEESLSAGAGDCGCGFDEGSLCSLLSDEWYQFASAEITPEQRDWMGALPRSIRFSIGDTRFAVIHGGVDNINEFLFPSSPAERKLDQLVASNTHCLIGGHSGLPFGEAIPCGDEDNEYRYWLNTGAIGMPANDGTTDGWYMVLEPDTAGAGIFVRWNRLKYDYAGAAETMATQGLGSAYSNALTTGLWPSMDVLPDAERSFQGRPLSPSPIRIG